MLQKELLSTLYSVADQGEAEGPCPPPPSPVKISHIKMATKDGHIGFMFLAPPHLSAESDAVIYEEILTKQIISAFRRPMTSFHMSF